LVKTITIRGQKQKLVDQKYINYLSEVSGIAAAAGVDISTWTTLHRTRRSN